MSAKWGDGRRTPARGPSGSSTEDVVRATVTECARRLEANVSIGKQEFLANQQAQDASCYLMIRIAEAIRDLPDEVKLAHDEINWVAVTGMRHRLAHQYAASTLSLCGLPRPVMSPSFSAPWAGRTEHCDHLPRSRAGAELPQHRRAVPPAAAVLPRPGRGLDAPRRPGTLPRPGAGPGCRLGQADRFPGGTGAGRRRGGSGAPDARRAGRAAARRRGARGRR